MFCLKCQEPSRVPVAGETPAWRRGTGVSQPWWSELRGLCCPASRVSSVGLGLSGQNREKMKEKPSFHQWRSCLLLTMTFTPGLLPRPPWSLLMQHSCSFSCFLLKLGFFEGLCPFSLMSLLAHLKNSRAVFKASSMEGLFPLSHASSFPWNGRREG